MIAIKRPKLEALQADNAAIQASVATLQEAVDDIVANGAGGNIAAPVLTAIANPTGLEADNSTFTLQPVNTGGTEGVIYTATGLPDGSSINASTGLITIVLDTAGAGTVTVTATNETGASSQSFYLYIQQVVPTIPLATSFYNGIIDSMVFGPRLELTLESGKTQTIFPQVSAVYLGAENQGNLREVRLKFSGGPRQAYVRFDLSTVTEAVTAAQLEVYVEKGESLTQAFIAETVDSNNWDPATITFQNRPAETGVVITETNPSDLEWHRWVTGDVTASVVAGIADDDLVSYKFGTDENFSLFIPLQPDLTVFFDQTPSATNVANSHQEHNQRNSKVMFLLALSVYLDPTAESDYCIALRDELVRLVKIIVTPGNEPDASGRLQGWTHGPICHALVLAAKVPAVTAELSAVEINRMEAIIDAMLFSANRSYNDGNTFVGDFAQQGITRPWWNPNHSEGYTGMFISGVLHRGSTGLDQLYADFDYDTELARYTGLGLSNIVDLWSLTTAELANDFGSIRDVDPYGEGRGVFAPLQYSGVVREDIPNQTLYTFGVNDPFGIYFNMASTMFAHEVVDSIEGYTYATAAPPSPSLGQIGMLYEFKASDADGLRSDLSYVIGGIVMNIITASTLMASGRWGEGVTPAELADMESRMVAGMIDFFHKSENGWAGRTNGQTATYFATDFGENYTLLKLLWDEYLRPRLYTVEAVAEPFPAIDFRTFTAEPVTGWALGGNAEITAFNAANGASIGGSGPQGYGTKWFSSEASVDLTLGALEIDFRASGSAGSGAIGLVNNPGTWPTEVNTGSIILTDQGEVRVGDTVNGSISGVTWANNAHYRAVFAESGDDVTITILKDQNPPNGTPDYQAEGDVYTVVGGANLISGPRVTFDPSHITLTARGVRQV